ncbi:hypothetical protein [Alistipes sp.]|uniref:hypothetical protein n=1 Tax=Alistipes sp. TaxID=1872444 RepID=UPI003AF063A6
MLAVLPSTACVGPRILRGYTYVASPEFEATTLRQAEVWLIAGRDTLRQQVDSAGRFCFERVPRRNWLVDGHHPRCTPPEPAIANWSKNPRPVVYNLKFYDRGIMPDDTTSRQLPPRRIWARPSQPKLRQFMPRRWAMAGTVHDSGVSTFFEGFAPSGIEGATVFFVHGGDTLRTRTDRWGRFFLEGMRHAEYDAWAEKEGYCPSRMRQVRPYSEESWPDGIRVSTCAAVELLLERLR